MRIFNWFLDSRFRGNDVGISLFKSHKVFPGRLGVGLVVVEDQDGGCFRQGFD